jgi:hypothetical protein
MALLIGKSSGSATWPRRPWNVEQCGKELVLVLSLKEPAFAAWSEEK